MPENASRLPDTDGTREVNVVSYHSLLTQKVSLVMGVKTSPISFMADFRPLFCVRDMVVTVITIVETTMMRNISKKIATRPM